MSDCIENMSSNNFLPKFSHMYQYFDIPPPPAALYVKFICLCIMSNFKSTELGPAQLKLVYYNGGIYTNLLINLIFLTPILQLYIKIKTHLYICHLLKVKLIKDAKISYRSTLLCKVNSRFNYVMPHF